MLQKNSRVLVFSGIFVIAMAIVVVAGVGPPAYNAIWADGSLYGTVATPANLSDHGPKEGLYVFEGLDGQRPVAEDKPGDRGYNGGRWQVYVLQFTEEGLAAHDGDDDGVADFELTSWEDVEFHIGLGHLEEAGMGPSFVCPLIK